MNAEACSPPAERTPSGYRRYGPQHVAAIRTARILMAGYGWAPAQHIMSALHRGEVAAALAEVDRRHAVLAQQRADMEAVRTTLQELAHARTKEETPLQQRGRPTLTIGEAARQVGVRASALRFWEAQGLLQPARDRTSRYRWYHAEHLRQVQIIALLRQGGYRFEAIRSVLAHLNSQTPEQVLAAIEARRLEVLAASKHCLAATGTLWTYIGEWLGEEPGWMDPR
jgi:DNA-binding transcriptional MerR regulator